MKKLKALLLSGIIASIIISCSNGASNKMSQFELSPELVHIDSVMQQRPDSAFMLLVDYHIDSIVISSEVEKSFLLINFISYLCKKLQHVPLG